MTTYQHIKTHRRFHKELDANVAEFITDTGALPSKTTLLEFMEWSAAMAKDLKGNNVEN